MSLVLSGKNRAPIAFFVRRFTRLYPLYITVAVATWAWWLFTWAYLGRMPTNGWYEHYRQMAWWNQALFMFSNWSMVGLDIQSLFHFRPDLGFLIFHAPDGAMSVGELRTVGQAWSIGCLIWFYLMAPFVVKLRNCWIVIIGLTSLALDLAMTRSVSKPIFSFQRYSTFSWSGFYCSVHM